MVPEKTHQVSANLFCELNTQTIFLEKHANHIVKTRVPVLKSTVPVNLDTLSSIQINWDSKPKLRDYYECHTADR